MISVRGIYQDGKITVICPSSQIIPDNSEVIVTFVVDADDGDTTEDSEVLEKKVETQIVEDTDIDESYFESLREFERVKAEGSITIIDQSRTFRFQLNDYSQGGLSFLSDWKYDIGKIISAGILDPNDRDSILMELEMEVRGVFDEDEEGYKIGCMFVDPIDEDLWHGLLPYLG